MSDFQPLEVVGRGSEKQLQVGENWNDIIEHFKGPYIYIYEWKQTIYNTKVKQIMKTLSYALFWKHYREQYIVTMS